MIRLVFINTENNILKVYYSENVPSVGHFVTIPVDKKEKEELTFRVREVQWKLKKVEVYIILDNM